MAHEELPKQFVASLKTLFDILDEGRTGFVRLGDIESRWQTDGPEEALPSGVIEALRKVTPSNGNLSFDRFVAGIKIALLRNRNQTHNQQPRVQTVQKPQHSQPPDLVNQTLQSTTTNPYSDRSNTRGSYAGPPQTSTQPPANGGWRQGERPAAMGQDYDAFRERGLSRWPKSTSALDKLGECSFWSFDMFIIMSTMLEILFYRGVLLLVSDLRTNIIFSETQLFGFRW